MSEIIIREQRQVDFAISQISTLNLNKEWRITIKPYVKKRTTSQNSIVHLWFGIIASETGNDADDVKEALKAKFLPARFVEIDGEMIEVRRSTAKLNTTEMAEFCNRMQAWAASELGIQLPTRDDMREAA